MYARLLVRSALPIYAALSPKPWQPSLSRFYYLIDIARPVLLPLGVLGEAGGALLLCINLIKGKAPKQPLGCPEERHHLAVPS